MEIKLKKMKNIPFIILLICLFTSCSEDTPDTNPKTTTDYDYFYPTDTATIEASHIGNGKGTLEPKGIAIANEKLYICNGDVLEVFNAITFDYIKTIKEYTKGTTTIPFSRLSSVCIDNGRIYIGSINSRLFIIDEITNKGINTVGNGQWTQTFVHVFGVTVKEGLVFIKEKESTIKVFETSQITETSNWNLTPIAKLNTLTGWDEIYSMDVEDGNLIVAGRDAKSYLYYNISSIRANALNSIKEPIKPEIAPVQTKPIAINFNTDWAITSENILNLNYIRLYKKSEFLKKEYEPIVNTFDIMGIKPFGTILSTAQLGDHIFLSDDTNKIIRILKLNKSTISEQEK